jgi:dihydroorotase
MCQADIQPNLVPPISSTERALEYREELRRIDPNVEWLMTLYLGPEITPEEIKKAAAAGISGMSIDAR